MLWLILLFGCSSPLPFFLACPTVKAKNANCFSASPLARDGRVTQIWPIGHIEKSLGGQGGKKSGKNFSSQNKRKQASDGKPSGCIDILLVYYYFGCGSM